jgi:hypothetical protein
LMAEAEPASPTDPLGALQLDEAIEPAAGTVILN